MKKLLVCMCFVFAIVVSVKTAEAGQISDILTCKVKRVSFYVSSILNSLGIK